MIQIIYDRQRSLVTIDGHAGSAEEGHDLVCAGVSAITYTLANAIENMSTAGHVTSRQIKLGKGNAVIRFTPKKTYTAVIQVIVDAICAGYDLLAEQYPHYVGYEIRK